VLARLIHGLRISVLFGLLLTLTSSMIGVAAGAVQGYFGGRLDLLFQRFLEIWGVAAVVYPDHRLQRGDAGILDPAVDPDAVWLDFAGGCGAGEFLRARNLDYVRAARALGMSDGRIMVKHVLPNAMVATLTFLPFILSGSIVGLTALDFLGLGLPPGSASLGDLLR